MGSSSLLLFFSSSLLLFFSSSLLFFFSSSLLLFFSSSLLLFFSLSLSLSLSLSPCRSPPRKSSPIQRHRVKVKASDFTCARGITFGLRLRNVGDTFASVIRIPYQVVT